MIDWHQARPILAVTTVIFYGIVLIFVVSQLIRLGIKKVPGYLGIGVFSVVRIGSGVVNIVMYSEIGDGRSPSVGIIIAEAVLLACATGPLQKVSTMFMTRVLNENKEFTGVIIPPRCVTFVDVLIVTGMVLSTAGGVMMSTESNFSLGLDIAKAGTITSFTVVLTVLAVALFFALRLRHIILPSSRIYVAGVILAAPFFIVRCSYSVAAIFNMNGAYISTDRFNAIFGDWIIYFTMMFLMEIVITLAYCISGYIAETKYARPELKNHDDFWLQLLVRDKQV